MLAVTRPRRERRGGKKGDTSRYWFLLRPGRRGGHPVCVFERTGPFIKSAEPVRMILVIHWSGRMPYSLPWVTYWPYIVEMEWYAFFVCLLFINLVLKMAGRRDRLRSWGYPSFGSLSLSVCLAFAHIFFFSFSYPFFLSFRATEDLSLLFRLRDERDEKEEVW